MEYCGLCRSEVHPEAVICPSCHASKEKAQSALKLIVGLLSGTIWLGFALFGWVALGFLNIVPTVLGFFAIRYLMNEAFDEGNVWQKRV